MHSSKKQHIAMTTVETFAVFAAKAFSFVVFFAEQTQAEEDNTERGRT